MILPPSEHIVETRSCLVTGNEFVITDKDILFYEKVSPVFAGKVHLFPFPTESPEIRSQQRMAFRNERSFHTAVCSLSDTPMVSMYHPEDDYRPCKIDLWRGDGWDPFSYGASIDFDRSFFEQFDDLYRSTPVM